MSNFERACATAVIPAYNEAEHIDRVLVPLRGVPQLQRIIVVDDGSTDSTADVVSALGAQDKRVHLVSLERNRGKGGAVMAGIQQSRTDLLVLLDADLIDLQAEHVSRLVQPVAQRRCSMSMGIFENGRERTNWSHRHFYFLSGQRCIRWPAFRQAAAFHRSRWGIEMALNLVAWRRNLTVQQVPWDGVSHTMRLEKRSGVKKYWTYVEMWADIIKFTVTYGLELWWEDDRLVQEVRARYGNGR